MDPVVLALPFRGTWIVQNSPASRVPSHGTELFGTRHVLLDGPWRWDVTSEQLFYQLAVTLKYLAVLPAVLLFVATTRPPEFASSLARLGVPYRFAYAISLGEFGATVFIARPDAPTVPIAIFRALGQPGAANVGQAMALSTVLLALTAGVILLVDRLADSRIGGF